MRRRSVPPSSLSTHTCSPHPAPAANATGTAAANPSDNALERRADSAPGGAETQVDDNRPAGAGQGRKVG